MKVEALREIANKAFPVDMNVMGKKLSAEKLEQIAAAIEKQKPHDLSKVLGKSAINRWSVLNRQHLVPVSGPCNEVVGTAMFVVTGCREAACTGSPV
ncbi:hypothetical protein D3C77_691980 [compost metagenome]